MQRPHLFCGRHVTTRGLASPASPPGVWPPAARGDAPGPVGVAAPLASRLRWQVNMRCSAKRISSGRGLVWWQGVGDGGVSVTNGGEMNKINFEVHVLQVLTCTKKAITI